MLGTGCAMVTQCFNTCFMIKLENGEYIMTDGGGGNGILRQLEAVGADYSRLHHLFVSHGHSDHIFGVVWLIRKIATLMGKGTYNGDFHIYCHDEVAHMIDVFSQMTLKKADRARLGNGISIQVIADGEDIPIFDTVLTAFDIHSTKAKQFGYRLCFADGMKLTCLGDEPYNDACHDYAIDSDWLLSEAFCQYGDREKFKPYEKHHSTVKEACETAEMLRARNLVLYHTEDKDMQGRKANYTAEGSQYYHGRLYVPDDLEVIDISSTAR